MIFIPGKLIAFLTFPGVIMHEISHRFMCDILRIPVYGVSYFNPEAQEIGYVIHHEITNIKHASLVAFAPLFFNSLVCMIFTFPFFSSLIITTEGIPNIFNLISCWIGISSGINALPSHQDINSVLSIPQKRSYTISTICYMIKFLNYLRIVWFDLFFAAIIGAIPPIIIFILFL